MPRCRFESGTKFFMDDLEHMILRVESKKITIELLKYKQAKICSLRELEEAFDEERLVFEDPGNRSNLVKLDPVDLTETEHAYLKMKISVLEPVIHDRFHKINVDDYLKSLREEKGLSISRATFYNWKKEWDQYGDARYLQKLKPGPKTRRHEKEVLGVISEIMEDNLYTGEDIDYSYIYGMYKDRIKEINELREDDVKLLIRSFQTIWRIVKEKRDFYRQNAATDGRVAARLERDGVKSMSERPIRPLERVELDWTPVDLLSVDPKTLQRKRAWIVYAIDVCTGEPLGFYITYDYPDTFAIKQCLLHCFLPKTYVKKLYPEVQNEWTAYGIPKELVIDNHKANDSFELEEIFELFGIDPLYPEIEAGHKKGTVERGLKTFNRLMRKLKGTTKSNFLDRKQYDSEGKACITLQGLYYIAHIFFVDIVSHNWSHSRMGGTPHQIWERAYETDPTLVKELPFSKKEIKLALCAGREKRTIQNKGITLERGRYWSDELAKIRYRLLQEGDEGREVTVRFDWMDVRKIYVQNPFDHRFVEAHLDTNYLHDIEKHYDVDPDLPLPFQQMKAICLTEDRKKRSFDDSHIIEAMKRIKNIEKDQNDDKKKKYKEALALEEKIQKELEMTSHDYEAVGDLEDMDSFKYIGEMTEEEYAKRKRKVPKVSKLAIDDQTTVQQYDSIQTDADDDLPDYDSI